MISKLPIYILIAGWFIFSGCENQANSSAENNSDSTSGSFDAELANELGADDYGMRQYVIAFLKAGPNRDQDSTRAAELQRGHMDNIQRLAEEGKLVLAGPFMDSEEVRGIFIFNVETIEEAQKLTESDPAVQAGRLEMELRSWYGSAALLQVNNIHSRISKINP